MQNISFKVLPPAYFICPKDFPVYLWIWEVYHFSTSVCLSWINVISGRTICTSRYWSRSIKLLGGWCYVEEQAMMWVWVYIWEAWVWSEVGKPSLCGQVSNFKRTRHTWERCEKASLPFAKEILDKNYWVINPPDSHDDAESLYLYLGGYWQSFTSPPPPNWHSCALCSCVTTIPWFLRP